MKQRNKPCENLGIFALKTYQYYACGKALHINLLKPTGYVTYQQFNLLKPTGYVMHQQFNIQQLYVLPTLYLCVCIYLRINSDLCHL